MQFLEHLAQGCVLGLSKCSFPRNAKDFRDGSAFPLHNSVVQIFKEPVQVPRQGATYAALAGSHEADEENRHRTGA